VECVWSTSLSNWLPKGVEFSGINYSEDDWRTLVTEILRSQWEVIATPPILLLFLSRPRLYFCFFRLLHLHQRAEAAMPDFMAGTPIFLNWSGRRTEAESRKRAYSFLNLANLMLSTCYASLIIACYFNPETLLSNVPEIHPTQRLSVS
jgi:hypothetical protein